MSEWLDERSKVERCIVGALLTAIEAHGPIRSDDPSTLASAAKRVYGTLKALRKQFNVGGPEDVETKVLKLLHGIFLDCHVCVGEKHGIHGDQDKVVDYDRLMREISKRLLEASE